MKNIHVIPTTEATNLIYHNGRYELLLPPEDKETWNNNVGKYIYITNDEEIKEGDWTLMFDDLGNLFLCDKPQQYLGIEKGHHLNKGLKKIILTTDQDLIKNGVQPIDDEFLEWFVNNPSCEFIKVEIYQYKGQNDLEYKIIIPNLEIWKDITNYEGYYQASNLGNIKSLSRTILGRGKHPTILKEKLLKFTISTNGYYQVILSKESNRQIFKVHSLIAICFLNHIPDGTHNVVIDHIDEVKINNKVENLRLIGHRENVSRSMKNTTSTYVGVSWSKNAKKWISQITIEGKTKYLGLFNNEKEANKKYLETLKEL